MEDILCSCWLRFKKKRQKSTAGKVVGGQIIENFHWLVRILISNGKTLKDFEEGSTLVRNGLQKD